jgi:hypothetical protein
MRDLDPTQYGEADAGGRRRADRLLVREKHCRSWLSKISQMIFSTTSAWVARGEWCGRCDRSFNPSSPSAS